MSKAKLYKKLVAVQQQLKPARESGKNNHQNYTYATASDVIEPVKRTCNREGLFIFLDVVESTIEPGRCSVKLKLTVADSETGEELSTTCFGYAEDWSYKNNSPTGDKAIYKAITGATKYAIREMFVLPSTDDPENDSASLPKSDSQSKNISTPSDLKLQKITQKQVARLYAIAKNESGLADEDIKAIIKTGYGYESVNNIVNAHYDTIVDHIKNAGSTLTLQQRKDLLNWWRIEKISDESAKQAMAALGYKSTALIPRQEINAVKAAILRTKTATV